MGHHRAQNIGALMIFASIFACEGDPTRLDLEIRADSEIARADIEMFEGQATSPFASGSIALPAAERGALSRTSTIVLLLPERLSGTVKLVVRGYAGDELLAEDELSISIERGKQTSARAE